MIKTRCFIILNKKLFIQTLFSALIYKYSALAIGKKIVLFSYYMAERAGIEPATDGIIRLLSILQTD